MGEVASRLTILLYESDLIAQVKVQSALKPYGYGVLVCTSPSGLMEMPDVAAAIVGLSAPGWLEAVQRLKEHHVPLVGYCGHAEVSLRQKARAAGVASVLPNSELARGVARALEHVIKLGQGLSREDSGAGAS